MNEEIRDMIGRALHDEPRLEVDREAVLRAGRRRLRLRRAGMAGGAALAVLAVVSASAVAGQLGREPDTGGAPAPQGCVSLSGAEEDIQRPEEWMARPEGLAESARLTAAFATFAFPPGITVEPSPVRLCSFGPGWRAHLRVSAGAGERAVTLDVHPHGGTTVGCGTVGGSETCRIETLPDGTVVRLSTTAPVGAATPVAVHVNAWRSDGTLVNLFEASPDGTATARVLSDDALIALVTAPQLRTEGAGQVGDTPPEASDRRAAELTAILAAGNALPAGMQALPVPDARAGALDFFMSQGGYKLSADLVDAAGEGNLFAYLDERAQGAAVACDSVTNCTMIALADGSAATVQTDGGDGVTRLTLSTVRPGGIQVMLTSSNVSERSTVRGKNVPAPTPTRAEPSLDVAALGRIAMLF